MGQSYNDVLHCNPKCASEAATTCPLVRSSGTVFIKKRRKEGAENTTFLLEIRKMSIKYELIYAYVFTASYLVKHRTTSSLP